MNDIDLASAISECAQSMEEEPDDKAPLRELQSKAKRALLEHEGDHERTIAYLLDVWIDDYYFNWAGDIDTEKVEEVQRRFAHDASRAMRKLAESLRGQNAEETLAALARLICRYLDAVREAKEILV